jgi:hypothetical protein
MMLNKICLLLLNSAVKKRIKTSLDFFFGESVCPQRAVRRSAEENCSQAEIQSIAVCAGHIKTRAGAHTQGPLIGNELGSLSGFPQEDSFPAPY